MYVPDRQADLPGRFNKEHR